MNRVRTGLDRFRDGDWKRFKGYRLGLLANQASVDHQMNPAREIIDRELPGQLSALFGPQHGYGCEEQDNMAETPHARDPVLGIPVYSLYAETREPVPHMLEELDVLIIDLQDVGTRVYTFASTMRLCLQAASRRGRKVLVLDRPNPLGGEIVEGNLLHPDYYSFVGPYRMPMRHGFTMGEMAQLFNRVFELGCDLEIIPMEGWRRSMLWHETGLRWVVPSPNMPLPETAYVYPGQVLWEGTNLSEGRGTCRPFEIFGAPFLDSGEVRRTVPPEALEGCLLQEYTFRPVFHKWAGERCCGFMIHIMDPRAYRPFLTSLALLRTVLDIHGGALEWKAPPYEYEYHRMPIDLIIGDPAVRKDLEMGRPVSFFQERWRTELKEFLDWRTPYLLYE
jgi:uncharacterized protein YbbC (DUF1343 family)